MPGEARERSRRKVLIVDDHPVLRRGLATLIESESDLAVCAEAADYRGALAAIENARPDIAIVDIALDGSDGIDLIKRMKVRYPDIPALVLSMHDELVYAERALRAGAAGYLNKKLLDETVLRAIRRVLEGRTFMTAELEARLARKFIAGDALRDDCPLDALSDRQLEVFGLVGRGRTTRQIAARLNLSIKTIETHLEHIKHKLGVGSAAELAQRATRWVETGHAT